MKRVASVNRDNEVTVPKPVDASAAGLERVGDPTIGVGWGKPSVDLTVDDSSAEVAEVVHDNQIPQNPHRDFELNRRDFSAGLEYLDQVELHNVFPNESVGHEERPIHDGVFRVALTTSMGEVLRGHDDGERGWKMLMLFPNALGTATRWQDFANESCRHGSTHDRTVAPVATSVPGAGVESRRSDAMTSREGFVGLKNSYIWVSCQQVVRHWTAPRWLPGMATLAQLTSPDRRPPRVPVS